MTELSALSPSDAPKPFKVSSGQAPINSSSSGSFSSFALHSLVRLGKRSRKILFKHSLRAQILEHQAPDMLAANRVFAQPLVHSSSFKEFLETNPGLLEVSCTQLHAPAHSTKSGSNCSHPTQFKYADFSLPNSNVKFLRGSPSKTLLLPSRKKGKASFNSSFSCEEDPVFALCYSSFSQPCKILDNLKSIVADCSLILAKGFVANSFYSGLTATEFFFHTMGGREGLVDTAVKTADTGYMSRRLIKALEDLSIYYDSSVRNAGGCIVQFCYGDDGMDPAQMEGKSGAPLNFERLFLKAKATCPSDGNKILSPSEFSETVEDRLSKDDASPECGCSPAFIGSLKIFLNKYIEAQKKSWSTLLADNETAVDKSIISSSDNDNIVIRNNVVQNIAGVTHRQLQVFLDTCLSRYHTKKIEAGTAIGAIGAQSIGEPGTQMTLKTFHFAGVASMNVTLGVPRIKEIINGAKRISTPIVTAALTHDDNVNIARMVKARIEKTNLGQSLAIHKKRPFSPKGEKRRNSSITTLASLQRTCIKPQTCIKPKMEEIIPNTTRIITTLENMVQVIPSPSEKEDNKIAQ
ncbi:DNA-directed RNA polymerase III subunit 1 [Cucumis melo var. makuwa]|uniref:DNA-directed RNA polymerase n=1 Tax=Cucumis melo var. makuwa TaxID=1194695 RepID=A0A5D3DD96_CUCMM|nr:DNA-directed RNA polymerase III subunit 1 [Cucumis melo var. makuwa]